MLTILQGIWRNIPEIFPKSRNILKSVSPGIRPLWNISWAKDEAYGWGTDSAYNYKKIIENIMNIVEPRTAIFRSLPRIVNKNVLQAKFIFKFEIDEKYPKDLTQYFIETYFLKYHIIFTIDKQHPYTNSWNN